MGRNERTQKGPFASALSHSLLDLSLRQMSVDKLQETRPHNLPSLSESDPGLLGMRGERGEPRQGKGKGKTRQVTTVVVPLSKAAGKSNVCHLPAVVPRLHLLSPILCDYKEAPPRQQRSSSSPSVGPWIPVSSRYPEASLRNLLCCSGVEPNDLRSTVGGPDWATRNPAIRLASEHDGEGVCEGVSRRGEEKNSNYGVHKKKMKREGGR
ncbi:uncharacterized protein TRIVIDRAFT_60545 [Trichoderma virens Gv29-8]|uniref:Uncharacterized protein n=1 Tax=Hypocrea virens (strain Gv29-8 / FGSC 10586) TaxID=413071 RepID=G9MR81_HYPVG|nr:uncharacterized protein TRIVIDRAFT_60545 [Trichoderma virens Gv29-8]EHK22606.1 hypothetical protein TRIVIDRAFT_60545 [Trichoderma virens Gv29-8]UKZ47655.1 hypothetical protein TrVGV298_001879 [Trichoderma virens]